MKNIRPDHEKIRRSSGVSLTLSLPPGILYHETRYIVKGYARFDPGGMLVTTPDNRQEFLTIQESDQSGHRDG